MAYREVPRMEIQEIIRCWQAGVGPREIASGTGLSRNTVRKYPCLRRGRLWRRQRRRASPGTVRRPMRSN